ncbi:GDP/GTP exchange factor for ARF [Rhizina undulata]
MATTQEDNLSVPPPPESLNRIPSSPVTAIPTGVAAPYDLPSTPISVAVDPVSLIITECITVTSAMRKNARWAQSSVSAILGGASPGYLSSGMETPIPGSPSGRKLKSGRQGDLDVGLAGRWGLRGKKGKSIQDNPLMSAFAKLRSDLQECKDIRKFDTPALLHPFLQVIRSSSTSGHITSLALIAVTKFFSYNLIARESPRLSLAMQNLSSAITHCRFEASDSQSDDVVLLRILKLMELMVAGPGGELLGDESVCEMMETTLNICCQLRLSEVLRRSAEMTMMAMCQSIFERLKHLDFEADAAGGNLETETKEEMESVSMEPAVNVNNGQSSEKRLLTAVGEAVADKPNTIKPGGVPATGRESFSDSEITEEEEVKPYSLPSIRELLRVLVEILDPHNKTHTDTMRVMSMRIIDVAFEVAGPSIAKHPSLAGLAKDNLCRHLFQLVRSDQMNILQESLRVTGTLLATSRGVLKLQQELFLCYLVTCLHPRVEIPREPGIDPVLYEGVPQSPKLIKASSPQSASGRSTPVPIKDRQRLGMEGGTRRPDAREAMVESVGALARIPSFMVELYVNYDCEVDRSDLCEDIIGFLSRNAFPDSATWSTTNVPPLCLDALLGYITFIADRLNDSPRYEGFPDPGKLQAQRARKQIIIQGASKFNEDPKRGIAFLAQHSVIDSVDNSESIAKFLKGTSRINKKILGEYISKQQNAQILEAFINQFDFTGKRIDEALRDMLGKFRLPGESQLIERIVTKFCERYRAKWATKEIADQDSMFVLTYAIIMLNTDQHNPNMKEARMKYEDFAKNLRGVNAGKDFAPEFLQSIYDAIKSNEIILPDEHDNKHAFDYAWKELLQSTEAAGELTICNTNIYDAHMFAATWKPIVATLSYVFMSATDDAVFSRVIAGFDQCSRIAAKYEVTEALDHIVRCLSIISTLATLSPPSTALNTEVQTSGNNIMVSELAVRFGRDYKAQLATIVLFKVVNGNEKVIANGWNPIIRSWLNLFVNSLIPPLFSPEKSGLEIPPIPLQTPSAVIERNQSSRDVGLFSTLSSYLSSYASDEPPEPSEEELDSTLVTVDCIDICAVNEIFENIMKLDTTALGPVMEALISQLPDFDQDNVNVVILTPEQTGPINGNGPTINKGPTYDPAVVFVLELSTCLVLRDEATVAAHGKTLAETLMAIIRTAGSTHNIVISRAIYYLLSLLKASHDHSYLNVPVVLHSIAALDKALIDKSGQSIIKGISKCVKCSSPLKSEMVNSPDFWILMRTLLSDKDAVAEVFTVMELIASESQGNVTSDNYVAVVSLLNDFATAGKIGSLYEQKQDKLVKRGGKTKKLTDRPDADIVVRGSKAVLMVHHLTTRVPTLITQSHLEKNEAWTTYWSPIFQSLSAQCINPCREVRNQAFTSLQRSLLSPELTSDDHHEWTAIFGDVLFPLITLLLKPEVFQSDPRGMSETRLQAATLLCRVFLHYLVMLSEWDGMLDLWLKILDIMDRLMNSGQGDHLEELVPESLKNILLVMSSGGYLVPPGEDSKHQELWNQTWKRLERFLPDLFGELFPQTTLEPPKTEAPRVSTEAVEAPQDVTAAV